MATPSWPGRNIYWQSTSTLKTSVDGLRIINFKDEVCLPHPETVELFCSRTCLAPDPDLKCCRNILR
jgi:hypothetical protein